LYYLASSAVGHDAVSFYLIQVNVAEPTAAAPVTSVPSVVDVVVVSKNLKSLVPFVAFVAVGSYN